MSAGPSRTLCIIKPDAGAAGNTDKILDMLEAANFVILGTQKIQLTQSRAEAFYKPHNDALAALLGDPSLTWPQGSTVVDAAALAATGLRPRASPLACDSALAG